MALNYSYDDSKAFDKRVGIESKKVKDIAAAMGKVKDQLEADRKANCIEFKKNFLVFCNGGGVVHTPRFKLIIDDFCGKLDALDKAYN
jgi:hypothetical protein